MPDAAGGLVLDEERLQDALGRFAVVRSHLHDGVALSAAAGQAGVSARTARRWLARYRSGGLAALAHPGRSDRGRRRTPAVLVELIEGLALRRPAPPIAFIHRRVVDVAREHGWPAPSYATVHAVVRALDPGLVVLAHDGPVRYRERYELVYRREAAAPNEIWQADHTQLDILILDEHGRKVRPWLTVIEDDHSRAIAGYVVFVGAPSTLQTALALRQAIWRKRTRHGRYAASRTSCTAITARTSPAATSTRSAPTCTSACGKLKRLFGTITSELLCGLPGWLTPRSARPATAPALSLAELDGAIGRFLVEDYNHRSHSETKQAPAQRWAAGGWLPRMPDSPEQLDMLLLRVARPRVVHRDGIRFEGQRYQALTLAGYVGEPVTIRYDPRDLAEIGVYHHDHFVCRAVSPELAAQMISLKDLQAARSARRRQLTTQLADRREHVDELLAAAPYPADRVDTAPPTAAAPRARRRLALYQEE